MKEKKSSECKQSNVNICTVLDGNNLLYSSSYFYFSYLYLSLAGNIIVYTPNQGTNREEYFNHIIYQGKDADSGGK